jgi:transcriptional regulator GlxA family with amidase domain
MKALFGCLVLSVAVTSIAALVPGQRTPGTATRVAFAVTEGATMIDFAGPWEVFQDVTLDGKPSPFELYTVGASTSPIRTSGGMTVTPDYGFAAAPTPQIVVVPAQRGGPELRDWLRKAYRDKAMVLSVWRAGGHRCRHRALRGVRAGRG